VVVWSSDGEPGREKRPSDNWITAARWNKGQTVPTPAKRMRILRDTVSLVRTRSEATLA
jgi:hypothetical protein